MPTTNIMDNKIEKPPPSDPKWIDWCVCSFYLLCLGLSIFQRFCQNTFLLLLHLFILNSAAIASSASGIAPPLNTDTIF